MAQIADWIDRVLGSGGDADTCERVKGEVRALCEQNPIHAAAATTS